MSFLLLRHVTIRSTITLSNSTRYNFFWFGLVHNVTLSLLVKALPYSSLSFFAQILFSDHFSKVAPSQLIVKRTITPGGPWNEVSPKAAINDVPPFIGVYTKPGEL